MTIMDDEFLYQLREQPDAQFAQDLQTKLSQKPMIHKWRLNMRFEVLSINRMSKIALGMVLIIGLITISPARAFFASIIRHIAEQTFTLTEDYPGDDIPNPDIIEAQIMSLEEAIAIFPYGIKLPTTIPDDFTLEENDVWVYTGEDAGPFSDSINIRWVSDKTVLELDITNRTESELIAPESIEEVSLDDEYTAVIIRGGWDANRKMWDDAWGTTRLQWQMDGLTYNLRGGGTDITIEQLTEMALSILEQ